MKANRTTIRVMSALAVLGTLTVAFAIDVGSRMHPQVGSPTGGSIETPPLSSENVGNTMVKGKPLLLAEVGKPAFPPSEPIIIKMTLRNETDAEIYIIETGAGRDNELEIKNASGEKLQLSEKGKKTMESPVLRQFVSKIGAGQAVQYKINVLDSYDLSPNAAYTVTVKRKILMQDKKKLVELKSNPVKVVVHP